MATSHTAIDCAPTDVEKCAIGKAIFGSAFELSQGLQMFREYFAYYESEVEGVQDEAANISLDPPWHVKSQYVATHQDVIDTLKMLRDHRDLKRTSLKDRMRKAKESVALDERSLNWGLDLTVRLAFMLNVRAGVVVQGRPRVEWPDNRTLSEFLKTQFPDPRWELDAREGRTDPKFTAAFMKDVCGMEIDWTNSLEDHLRIDRETLKLWIFSNKRYLQALLTNDDFKDYETWLVRFPN